MELRHIRYFLALAEELNFSRAAEKLHISQPPLSRQIQELEDKIGTPLFYRTKRQVELTNAGRIFLNNAYQILDQVDRAYVNTRLSATGIEGEFRIGFNGIVQDIIPTLQKYRERYPNVGIILKHMTATEQIKALNEKRIDIGTVTVPVTHDKIQVSPLKRVQFMAAFPDKHPLASKQSIYLNDLAEETFIITPKSAGPLYYEAFMSAFENADFIPKITIQAHDLQTVMALVAAGMGVTLTPALTKHFDRVVLRNVEDFHLSIDASLAWRKDNRSVILENFLTFFFEFKDEIFHSQDNKKT